MSLLFLLVASLGCCEMADDDLHLSGLNEPRVQLRRKDTSSRHLWPAPVLTQENGAVLTISSRNGHGGKFGRP